MQITVDIPDQIANDILLNGCGRRRISEKYGITNHQANLYVNVCNKTELKRFKTMLVISDLHCGHQCGLTPPTWQYRESDLHYLSKRSMFASEQEELYNIFLEKVNFYKPIDILVVNGDAIEGKNSRQGSTELITADRNEQVEMAVSCINEIEAKDIIILYGTPYHSGEEDDWELQIAKRVNAKSIGSHEWIDVYGKVFDFKHKVASSSVPYGRATPLLREQLWNILWAERGLQPNSDFIIRSHVHYASSIRNSMNKYTITTPGLQGFGSKFGARQCSGTIDIGVTYFMIYSDSSVYWEFNIFNLKSHYPNIIKIN